MTEKKEKHNLLLKMKPIHRAFVALLISLIAVFAFRRSGLNHLLLAMLGWDVFALTIICLTWYVIITRTPSQIRQTARKDDGSRLFVFLVVILCCLACMVTVLLLIVSKDTANIPVAVYLPICIAGMLLSWVVVHTIFTFHYAHMYYDDLPQDESKQAEGLEFPNEDCPDYIDFAYFSFVIGMTFQVSDVQITARQIRKQVLFHGLLSFALNTFVVALTINLIAGLKS